jgi:hypothetical protein
LSAKDIPDFKLTPKGAAPETVLTKDNFDITNGFKLTGVTGKFSTKAEWASSVATSSAWSG